MKLVGSLMKWTGIGLYAASAVAIIMFMTPIGGWKALNVLTGSMEPAISPGDLVFIHRTPVSQINPGDVVTYTRPQNPSQTITHRVVSKETKNGVLMVTTKGDANPQADPAFTNGRIVGKVVNVMPGAGHWLGQLRSPVLLAALIIIPGLIVIWFESRNLRRLLAAGRAAAEAARDAARRATVPPVRLQPQRATPISASPRRAAQPRSRRMDGLRSLIILPLALALMALATGSTFAAVMGRISLTDNHFSVAATTPTPTPSATPSPSHTPSPTPSPTTSPSTSPSPTPSPSGSPHAGCPTSVTISNTGPGSTNIVSCTGSTHASVTSDGIFTRAGHVITSIFWPISRWPFNN